MGNRNEVLFRLLAMTGMRRSEAVGLRWSDVDLRAGALTIAQAATVVDGEEVVDVPKTRRSRRTIDVDPDTVAMIERHQSEQRELLLRLGVTSPAGDRVFTNELGDPIRPGSVGQAFGRLVVSAGVPRIRLHDLRHTHASHLLMAGVNVKVVSERLACIGELHPRHLWPRHARPTGSSSGGRRIVAEGVRSMLPSRFMSATI